mmetsp:Transcript_32668/g.113071  ORF Transcript_32668/g.113071 Transcript_32668/m.113071 type:complete len:280 (-) Transcript_32668:7-846(-)
MRRPDHGGAHTVRAYFSSAPRHSEACMPLGVRCVTTPGQFFATIVQWSDQLESSKKSMPTYEMPVPSLRIGKCVADLSEERGELRPIWTLPWKSAGQPRARVSRTVTPGSTSNIARAACAMRAAKGVSADDATARRIGSCSPSAHSWSACSAPGKRRITSEPDSTPTTPWPLPLRSPRMARPGIEVKVNISGCHTQSSRSNTHSSGRLCADAHKRPRRGAEEPPRNAQAWRRTSAAATVARMRPKWQGTARAVGACFKGRRSPRRDRTRLRLEYSETRR